MAAAMGKAEPPYLRVATKASVAVVTLAREPVNTMNLKFWQDLMATLEQLEADPRVRAVIFTSGLRRDVFTAGNDIQELYAPNTSKERYRWGRGCLPAKGSKGAGPAGLPAAATRPWPQRSQLTAPRSAWPGSFGSRPTSSWPASTSPRS